MLILQKRDLICPDPNLNPKTFQNYEIAVSWFLELLRASKYPVFSISEILAFEILVFPRKYNAWQKMSFEHFHYTIQSTFGQTPNRFFINNIINNYSSS